jgi:hypothetical protein
VHHELRIYSLDNSLGEVISTGSRGTLDLLEATFVSIALAVYCAALHTYVRSTPAVLAANTCGICFPSPPLVYIARSSVILYSFQFNPLLPIQQSLRARSIQVSVIRAHQVLSAANKTSTSATTGDLGIRRNLVHEIECTVISKSRHSRPSPSRLRNRTGTRSRSRGMTLKIFTVPPHDPGDPMSPPPHRAISKGPTCKRLHLLTSASALCRANRSHR